MTVPMLPDITLVLGVDQATLAQLKVSYRTWYKFHPYLWDWPWVIFYDWHQIEPADISRVVHLPQGTRFHQWPIGLIEYPTRRAMMLTGWVYMPPLYVRTGWWMKLDCDAIALERRDDWLDPQWFVDSESYIGNRWGYTKAKGDLRTATEWAGALERFCEGIEGGRIISLMPHVNGSRINVPRMASWLSFYRTDWTRLLAAECARHCGPWNLPVPSQDTCAWLYGECRGDKPILTRFKRRGWTNVPKLKNLEARTLEVMKT